MAMSVLNYKSNGWLRLLFGLYLATSFGPLVEALDNGVGMTPMMGWMAWIRFRCNINCDLDPDNCVSEKLFMSMADHLAEDGYKDVGYDYISIDDCWQASKRAPNGTILADPKRFPSGMKALGDYIHGKGLKFGLYTAMGSTTCQGYPALDCQTVDNCARAKQDVDTYVSYGIDYIKVDSCGGSNSPAFNTTHPYLSGLFLAAANKTGRPVLYHPSGLALEEIGSGRAVQYRLFAKIANMWRSYADMQASWVEVNKIIDFWAADSVAGHKLNEPNDWENFLSVSQPGVVQDPDALLIGNANTSSGCRDCVVRGKDFCPDKKAPEKPCICCGSLSPVEEQTNMVMWSMWAAPLEIAADLRDINAASAAILKNAEVIAVNQDPLVYQGRRALNIAGKQVWKKHLVDDSVAVALYNSNDNATAIPFNFSDVGFTRVDQVMVRDVINHKDLGTHVGGIELDELIPGHGCALLKLTIVWG
eukprot:m.34278 g.34278  ORF g.34278 m.34278 type:complete len:475 (-) comp16955_c0_seq1:136-1560(-)